MTPREPDRYEEPQPEPPFWRVGNHYGIHVYRGNVPIATFHTVAYARAAVSAYNASIRALASSAAAPAASRPSEPAAPAPDLRCEACGDRLADEDAMRAHDRTWHGTVEAELRDRIAELEAALKKATVQIGILLDRMRGCNEEVRQGRRDKDGHDLSLFEGPAWITEHQAKLPSKPPGAGEGTT